MLDAEATELGYDPDRVVKVTIGRLVEALADALNVVEDVDAPKWQRGDRAFVEVEVVRSGSGFVNVIIAGIAPARTVVVRDDLLIPKVT